MRTRRTPPADGQSGFHFSDAMQQLQAGQAAMAAGNAEVACTAFATASQLDSTLTEAFIGLGFSLGNLGRFDEAVVAFEHVCAHDPDHPLGNFGLGMALMELGEGDAGIPYLTRAAVLLPPDSDLLVSIAEMLLTVEESEGAMVVVRRGLKHDAHNAALLQIQARIHLYQEEPEKALHVLNALVKREPENVDARYFLGIALGEAGKPEEALVVYRRLREEDPAFVGACLGEATALLALERIDEAKTALEPLHAYAEQDPMIAMAIGQFYLQIVDLLQTLRYFRLAVQLEPDLTELYPPIIEISMQLGDQAGAQQVLDALRKVDPVLAAQVMVTLMPPVAPTRGRGALGRAVKPVAAMPKETILQLKVTLKGSKPPIWRRILVPADITLATFHDILQTVMGWTDSHLHQFIIDGAYYGVPDREGWGPPVQSEKRAKLNALGLQEKSRFTYEYDFGDSWEHDILVEKLLAPEKGVRYPRCVKGKGACPPEDIGGVWGYEHFLEVMANPKDPEHAEMLEWYGGDFDPTAFTCDDINAMLAPVRKKK